MFSEGASIIAIVALTASSIYIIGKAVCLLKKHSYFFESHYFGKIP
jgi:hypothetical protein